jgi:hypothetical protein
MSSLERETLREVIATLEAHDHELGNKHTSKITNLKIKMQSLDIVASMKNAPKQQHPNLLERLTALEPVIVIAILLLIVALNVLGIEVDPATILP